MEEKLKKLDSLAEEHGNVSKLVFGRCGGSLFPVDVLVLAVVNRSLQLRKSFHLLIENGCYTTAVALLRLQLDNVLRLYGVLQTSDPHATAHKVIGGKSLRSMKDKDGKPLHDAHLVDLLAPKIPWLRHVYNLCCSYIHLSDQHFYHLLAQSAVIDVDGTRNVTVGDGDDHVVIEHKRQAIQAFIAITEGLLSLANSWVKTGAAFGSCTELRQRFPVVR
ncbi:MAG TPA: hypothetical protein VFY81_01660 [Gammaproteobacteria bacterium]|nr:hypothetical protein [Gammaproteobacteria bacterium]